MRRLAYGCYCGRFQTDDKGEAGKRGRIIPGVLRCPECPPTRTYLCIYRECRAHTIKALNGLPAQWILCPKCQNPAYPEMEAVHPRHLPMLAETIWLGLYGEIPSSITVGPEWDSRMRGALTLEFRQKHPDLTESEAFAAACTTYQDFLLTVTGYKASATSAR